MKSTGFYFTRVALSIHQKRVVLRSLGHMVKHKSQPYFSAMFFVVILQKLLRVCLVLYYSCLKKNNYLTTICFRAACFAKAFQRAPKSMTSSVTSALDMMTGSITTLSEARTLMYVFEVSLEIKEDEGKVNN